MNFFCTSSDHRRIELPFGPPVSITRVLLARTAFVAFLYARKKGVSQEFPNKLDGRGSLFLPGLDGT